MTVDSCYRAELYRAANTIDTPATTDTARPLLQAATATLPAATGNAGTTAITDIAATAATAATDALAI